MTRDREPRAWAAEVLLPGDKIDGGEVAMVYGLAGPLRAKVKIEFTDGTSRVVSRRDKFVVARGGRS